MAANLSPERQMRSDYKCRFLVAWRATVGFYGQAVRIGHGSAGGWSVFGPRRMITNARDNVL